MIRIQDVLIPMRFSALMLQVIFSCVCFASQVTQIYCIINNYYLLERHF